MPLAISPRLRIEQGATIMPMVRNEPLEIAAARSSSDRLHRPAHRTSATFIGLVRQGDFRGARHHQMAFHRKFFQGLQQAHAIDHAGSPGNTDN